MDKDDPNTGQGTSSNDIPLLLAHYGVVRNCRPTGAMRPRRVVATGMAALKHYLAAGRKVIVSVNAELDLG